MCVCSICRSCTLSLFWFTAKWNRTHLYGEISKVIRRDTVVAVVAIIVVQYSSHSIPRFQQPETHHILLNTKIAATMAFQLANHTHTSDSHCTASVQTHGVRLSFVPNTCRHFMLQCWSRYAKAHVRGKADETPTNNQRHWWTWEWEVERTTTTKTTPS